MSTLSHCLHTACGRVQAFNVLDCVQATDAGEAFMQKVVHTLLPKAEPVEDGARTGTIQPNTRAAPAPAPPTLAQTASAAKKQVQCVR